MATPHENEEYCIFCGEWIDKKDIQRAHIIPLKRGGCSCDPNFVNTCPECNWSVRGQRTYTPLEWWAEMQWKNQWEDDNGKPSVNRFDADAWTLEERQDFLLEAAYYEARARWHIMTAHKDKELPNW